MKTDGKIWLTSKETAFGSGRIKLLEKIDETGSISKAAAAVGMSYKAAWDALDKMDNLSEEPLVIRATGGRKGGGTKLTAYARQIIETFYEVSEKHAKILDELDDDEKDIGINLVQSSTKNLFQGTVSTIVSGGVNSTVGIKLRGEDTLAAVITKDSVSRMGLKSGDRVYALVNESSVTILKGDGRNLAISARNRILGHIDRINIAGISAEIEIKLPGGHSVFTKITAESVDSMGLVEGDTVTALFKAQSVMILK